MSALAWLFVSIAFFGAGTYLMFGDGADYLPPFVSQMFGLMLFPSLFAAILEGVEGAQTWRERRRERQSEERWPY